MNFISHLIANVPPSDISCGVYQNRFSHHRQYEYDDIEDQASRFGRKELCDSTFHTVETITGVGKSRQTTLIIFMCPSSLSVI